MRPAINIWAFPADWPMERILAVAGEAGFEAIELDYGLSYRRGSEPVTPASWCCTTWWYHWM